MNKLKNYVSKHKAITLILLTFLLVLGFFGFNKYLDWQNRRDIENLYSDLIALEQKMEQETGEEFYLEGRCGSGPEKFSSNYGCNVVLTHYNYLVPVVNIPENLIEVHGCYVIDNSSALANGGLSCALEVRPPNRDLAVILFSN